MSDGSQSSHGVVLVQRQKRSVTWFNPERRSGLGGSTWLFVSVQAQSPSGGLRTPPTTTGINIT